MEFETDRGPQEGDIRDREGGIKGSEEVQNHRTEKNQTHSTPLPIETPARPKPTTIDLNHSPTESAIIPLTSQTLRPPESKNRTLTYHKYTKMYQTITKPWMPGGSMQRMEIKMVMQVDGETTRNNNHTAYMSRITDLPTNPTRNEKIT